MTVLAPKKSDDAEEVYFPSAHLEWEKDYELPDEGTMTVKFRIRTTSREVQAERQSVDLELMEIVDVTPSKPAMKEDEDTGEVLDRLRAEYEDEGE